MAVSNVGVYLFNSFASKNIRYTLKSNLIICELNFCVLGLGQLDLIGRVPVD